MTQKKLVVHDTTKIDAGKHTGMIKIVELNDTSEYDYLDVYIAIDGFEELDKFKIGFNANISELSQLGRFLKASGMDLSVGDEITIKQINDSLVGRKLEFQTFNDDNGFCRVTKETIKFI